MKKSNRQYWLIVFSILLCGTSATLYYLQIRIFNRPGETFFYLFQDLAFVPVQVLLVTLFINELMSRRDKKLLLGKMNMVIGIFFSEAGSLLLSMLSRFDSGLDSIRASLMINGGSGAEDFKNSSKAIAAHHPYIDHRKGSLPQVKDFLASKRGFFAGLLENQNLLEHETFTEMLWAVFHLMEELGHRTDLNNLPATDLKHLEGDIHRAYSLLLYEWLSYVEHLKASYPYIYSLVVRTNPFTTNHIPVVY